MSRKREVDNIDTALSGRSKAELIALIKLMLRRDPDLEALLEGPLPGSKPKGAVKLETFRRQAEAAFDRSDGEYGSWEQVAEDLKAVKAVGDDFQKRNEYAAAAAVYQGVLEGICKQYESQEDHDGDICGVASACSAGLGLCLAALPDDRTQRQGILRALFEVVVLDAELGGIALGDEAGAVIEAQATPEENRVLAGWIREALPGARDFVRQCLGGWLTDLEQDTLDDEAYLKLCRETGQKMALVDRLLERGRTDEALAEVRSSSDYDLLHYADLLVRHRQGKTADALIAERARTSSDIRLVEWLEGRAAKGGDRAAMLELGEQIFRNRPSLEGYKKLCKLAEAEGNRDELRARLLQQLQTSKREDVLIRVYLDEGDVEKALAGVKDKRPSINYRYTSGLDLDVAKAAEQTHPREAMAIYRKYAETFIEQRGRENYKAACGYLGKMRDLLAKAGASAEWRTYIAALRETHKSLRALLEEMQAAKL